MTDAPINLNRARKVKAREEARKAAEANARKFGRSKAARVMEAAQNTKARAMLDQHQLDEDV